MRRKLGLPACLIAFLTFALAPPAHATIIASLFNVADLGNGTFRWSYNLSLSADERLDPAATNGVTCPGPGGTKVQCSPIGTFATLYDIKGFVSASATLAGWTPTIHFIGLTPSSIGGSFDDPGIVNVSFGYSGPVVHGGLTGVVFSGFSFVSTFGDPASGNFTSQSTKDGGSTDGLTDQTAGPLTVPGGSTPEPATMGMIAAGLFGLALAGRRKWGLS